jgi:hypothetical protein
MSSIIRFSLAMLLLVFISCNPDEDLDNNGNSGNNGNNGNNGGGNTINPVSYPEIVNLLEGNWYGDSVVSFQEDGSEFMTYNSIGTMSVGFVTFGSSSIGDVDFTPMLSSIQAPPLESLQVAKYPASVTITNGSWSGSGPEVLSGGAFTFASESNIYADKSYCVVQFTTPFFNVTTPTIQYGIVTSSGYNGYYSDVRIGSQYEELLPYMRIHTLDSTSLKLVTPFPGLGYLMFFFSRQ